MIHGTEIRVDFASDENGFIELPPEAASQPWARIGQLVSTVEPLNADTPEIWTPLKYGHFLMSQLWQFCTKLPLN